MEAWLIDEEKARANTAENEKLRFSLLLKPGLRSVLVRYGDGYFNSVLIAGLRNGPFRGHPEVADMLQSIHENQPGGDSRSDCQQLIEHMTERRSGNHGLLQVQYAFLELPKLPARKPERGADLWAWLFVHAPELDAVPADLPPGPYREALELANKATFSQQELDAYQKVIDEIQQVRELAEAKWAEGKAVGIAEGHESGLAEGKRDAVLRLLARRDVEFTDDDRARIAACADIATLDQWSDKALEARTVAEVFS